MTKTVTVLENILNANDRIAASNRAQLDQADVFGLNVMASPGAGKTSVIEKMIAGLSQELRMAVIEGDLATSIDAERIEAMGAEAVQINTGGNCHLDAVMLQEALPHLTLEAIDLLVVENVGNLICPSNFTLGTHANVLIASVPEGADKPYKYPGMYRGVEVVILNKIDLLPYVPFDLDYFRQGVEILNPGVAVFPLSCRTGEGVQAWLDWVRLRVTVSVADKIPATRG
ncbi:MAG: hydrogenase accessory protein HypB [Anaerolineaceae bacterium]|nr:hydrogenase accessory protein HypB [Anaerolineaceae bacterium]